MDLKMYPTPHAQAAARIVDGSAIIVLADSGQVNVLNAVGTRIWELVDGTRTVQEIADRICAEYEVAESVALQDVVELLQQLVDSRSIEMQEYPVVPGAPTDTPG